MRIPNIREDYNLSMTLVNERCQVYASIFPWNLAFQLLFRIEFASGLVLEHRCD